MSKSRNNNDYILSEFLYRDILTWALTIIGTVTVFTLVFKYDFPAYLIYIFLFAMMVLSLYRYALFIKSKNIKSRKTKEGVVVEVGNKKWLEPKSFFSKVGIFLLFYYSLVGVFYYFSRKGGITQFLIFMGLVIWGWLIKKGIVRKK